MRYPRELLALQALVVLGVLLAAMALSVSAEVVEIQDPGLEAAIRDAIGKPAGDIDDSDLIGLTSLDASSRRISNLGGIQYCTDLIELHLMHNEITDISPLGGLTNLVRLILDYNQIVSITTLASLTNLTVLHLSVNRIVDISSLSALTNLTWLKLRHNQIVRVGALANLNNLADLDLEGNQIIHLAPWPNLSNLMELNLGDNQIVDISPLSVLTNLMRLNLWQNSIVDITPLSALTNLVWLVLERNRVIDISPLSGLTKLTELSLYQNLNIVDISPLSGLASLTTLGLGFNLIVNISPLSGLTNLIELDLQENQIADISPLSGLTNLMELGLDGNQILDISALIENDGLASGDWIDVSHNLLDLEASSEDRINIQTLIERGVDVTYTPQDEPQKAPENQPPDTLELSVAIGWTEGTASFAWTGTDDATSMSDLVYSFRLLEPDSPDPQWSNWSSITTKYFSDLEDGEYEFQVRAKDADGNIDPTPWTSAFVILASGSESNQSSGFWAEVTNAPLGVRTIRNKPGTDDTEKLRRVPNEWVLWVEDTHEDTQEANGFIWWEISDSTDSGCTSCVSGWMAAKRSDESKTYLEQNSDQESLERHADPAECDTLSERKLAIVDAVKHYYGAINGTSLYSSDGFGWMRTIGFPVEIVLAMLIVESSIVNFDNQWVSYDYGHGVGQITVCDSCNWDNRGISSGIWLADCDYGGSQQMPVLNASYSYTGRPYTGNRYYSNTRQSIFANVKDAFRVLTDKYTSLPAGSNIERMRAAIWAYNAGEGNACLAVDTTVCQGAGYLKCVIEEVKNLETVFPGYEDKLYGELNDEERSVISSNLSAFVDVPMWVEGYICSPVEIRVIDELGRMSGALSGENLIEIPHSFHIAGSFIVFGESDLQFDVVGIDSGVYDLRLIRVTQDRTTVFSVDNFGTSVDAIHHYELDWTKLSRDAVGATIHIDSDGDGMFENSIEAGTQIDGGDSPSPGLNEGAIALAPNPVQSNGMVFLYSLPPEVANAELRIFSITGRLVARISLNTDANRFPIGGTWQPVNAEGIELANGPYVCVLYSDGRVVATAKMVIMR